MTSPSLRPNLLPQTSHIPGTLAVCPHMVDVLSVGGISGALCGRPRLWTVHSRVLRPEWDRGGPVYARCIRGAWVT